MKVKNIVLNSILLIVYCMCCFSIYTNKTVDNKKIKVKSSTIISTGKKTNNEILATLYIPKININRNIYPIKSPKNNVDENIMILKESTLPDTEDSTVFLAAHSGNGLVAYFNDLKELEPNDKVYFIYKQKTYIYKVTKIHEIKKNGFLTGNYNKDKELILTTCSNNKNKQLIVNTILEKKED
jgi:LPXTG-site transpeptidase (sortase) family protein